MHDDDIRRAVDEAYDAVGRHGSRAPAGLALPTGAELARRLGYPEAVLARLPAAALEAFVGAAALALEVTGPPGDLVLDLGCGAGVDTLTLARRGYRVLAVDASRPMLERLAGAAAGPVWPVRGRLPRLPVRTGVAGWALLNGVANLVPQRAELLAEVRRALRPGGTLLVADLLAVGDVPPELRELPEAWAWCIGGAASPEQWARDLEAAGFGRPEIAVLEPIPPLARTRLRAVAR